MNQKQKREQDKLDKIQFFLARTTEPFDDWDYDGDLLKIFFGSELIECYKRSDLEKVIQKFNKDGFKE